MPLVEGKRNVYRYLIGKPEANRLLQRPSIKESIILKGIVKE
jgi:hypothetical protein